MTEEELQEIEARANAATEGPWDACLSSGVCRAPPGEDHHSSIGHIRTKQDQEFIAHARTDVPKLVAEVRRLRKLTGVGEGRRYQTEPDSWDRGGLGSQGSP